MYSAIAPMTSKVIAMVEYLSPLLYIQNAGNPDKITGPINACNQNIALMNNAIVAVMG